MNCRRAKKLILEFVDGLPNEKLRLDLETHLGSCVACEKIASDMTRSLELLRRTPVEPLDDNFNWKVRLAVHKERSAMQQRAISQGSLLRTWNMRYGISAAAGVVAVVAVGWLAVQWSAPTLFDNGVESPLTTQAPLATDTNTEPAPAPNDIAATSSQGVRPRSSGPLVRVGLGNSPAVSSSTRLDAIDIDDGSSSIDSLVQAELNAMAPEEREAYLRELIDGLQGLLDRYEANPSGR